MGNNIETVYEEREFTVLIAQGQLLFASAFILHFTLLKSLPEGRKLSTGRVGGVFQDVPDSAEAPGAGDVLHTGQRAVADFLGCGYYPLQSFPVRRCTAYMP